MKKELMSIMDELSEKALGNFNDDEITELINICLNLEQKLKKLIDLLIREGEAYDDVYNVLNAINVFRFNLVFDKSLKV